MATLTVTQKSGFPTKLKLQLATVLILAGLACGVWYGSSYFQAEVTANDKVDGQYASLFANIKSVDSELVAVSAEIQESGQSLTGDFMSKDEFVTFLGETSERLNLTLNKYTGGDTSSKDGIEVINFKIEARGELSNLTTLIASIDSLKTPYAINALSMRKSDNYVWFDRDINKMEILDWWDGKSLEQKKAYTEVEDIPPIGVADIMGSADLYMYMDISFTTSSQGGEEK